MSAFVFVNGLVTEWFPRAAVTPDLLHAGALAPPDVESRITWKNVRVRPAVTSIIQPATDRSHYYAARETDAAPLESGADRKSFSSIAASAVSRRRDGNGRGRRLG